MKSDVKFAMLFDLGLPSFNKVIVTISVIFSRCCASCLNNTIQYLHSLGHIEGATLRSCFFCFSSGNRVLLLAVEP